MSFLGSFETSFIIWINILNQLDCFNQNNRNSQNHIETRNFKVIFLSFTLELRSFAFVEQNTTSSQMKKYGYIWYITWHDV